MADTDEYFESSEEEEMFFVNYLNLRRPREIRERVNYLNVLDEVDFRRRFRISKDTFMFVHTLIDERIRPPSDKNNAVSSIVRLQLALRYFATGCLYLVVADFSGVSEASACNFIKLVSFAIASLSHRFIKMPVSEEEKASVIQQFYRIARFPQVIGAIDCTHIKIMSLGGNQAEVYRNRKGWFSLNVQSVAMANLKFADIVCRWPGSAHDLTIFNNSRLKRQLEGGVYGNCFILGDSGYQTKKYLMTPLPNPATPAESLYNEAQIRSRNVVERQYGVWKRRFPVLQTGIKSNRMELVQATVMATAVLHNIAIEQGEPHLLDSDINLEDVPVPIYNGQEDDGVRNQLIWQYFANL